MKRRVAPIRRAAGIVRLFKRRIGDAIRLFVGVGNIDATKRRDDENAERPKAFFHLQKPFAAKAIKQPLATPDQAPRREGKQSTSFFSKAT